MTEHTPEQIRRTKLLGSLFLFTKVFYKLRTGNDFSIAEPVGREARQITLCRELTKVFRGDTQNLMINIQPGSGKSEILIHFVAWAMARFPDSKFLFVSHTKSLAEKHTHTIKKILELPEYRAIFGIDVSKDTNAKGYFSTTAGGEVAAFGSGGGITGRDAGMPNRDRFAGALIMDDMHKPDEVHSDTIREGVIKNYMDTIDRRLRSPTTPMIMIGQRLHEADICGQIEEDIDGKDWSYVKLKTIDDAGNNLCPDVISDKQLRILQEKSPYVYASQYQQNPQPAGGGIFKEAWFIKHDIEPNILATFITADTAETSDTHNDATVFSFWGLYKVVYEGVETGEMGLHWIDCHEMWVEPKDLKAAFLQFYAECMRHRVKPKMSAIEKKSTGTTLVSILSDIPGLQILDIERTARSGSKADRFIKIQAYVASKQISLPTIGKHTANVIAHMSKITANDTHRRDDIADTLVDAVQIGLIDKLLSNLYVSKSESATSAAKELADHNARLRQSFNKRYVANKWQ